VVVRTPVESAEAPTQDHEVVFVLNSSTSCAGAYPWTTDVSLAAFACRCTSEAGAVRSSRSDLAGPDAQSPLPTGPGVAFPPPSGGGAGLLPESRDLSRNPAGLPQIDPTPLSRSNLPARPSGSYNRDKFGPDPGYPPRVYEATDQIGDRAEWAHELRMLDRFTTADITCARPMGASRLLGHHSFFAHGHRKFSTSIRSSTEESTRE
jgi:hypothetical protein